MSNPDSRRLAPPGKVLVAIEPEAFSVPDIADRLSVDIAHVSVGGNVVAAHHHVAAGIDVQPLENERARHLVGVEVGAGSEEREPSSVVFSPQVRNLRLIR